MGTCSVQLPTELVNTLNRLEQGLDTYSIEAAKEAEVIMVNALKEECEKHHTAKRDKTRGEMVRSIKATKPRRNKYGVFDFVRPTGKDSKGVRNMEKLAYLEYGRAGQKATPVIVPTANRIQIQIAECVQRSIERQAGL